MKSRRWAGWTAVLAGAFGACSILAACDSRRAAATEGAAKPIAAPSEPTVPIVPAVDASRPRTGLEVWLSADGVSLVTPSGPVGDGCTGTSGVTVPRHGNVSQDFAAVTRCARTLKTKGLANDTAALLRPTSETKYQDVISALDALRSDATGELFPDVTFALPTPAPPRPKAAPAPPHTTDSTIVSLSSSTAEEEGTAVILSRTQLIVGDEKLLDYDGPEAVRSSGLPAALKRGGAAGYFVTPLAVRLAHERELTQKVRAAKGIDPARTLEAIIIADQSIPYRLLMEVLYTAGESGYGKYHLMVLQTGR